MRGLDIKVFFLVLLLILPNCSTSKIKQKEIENALSALPPTSLTSVDFAYDKMIDAGIKSDFAIKVQAQYLKEKEIENQRSHIINLNVLGFLSPGDYSKHYSQSAVKQIKKFIKKYRNTLTRAEKELQVPKETIAALLWVETKHGKTMGTYKLPIVYFSLLQANHPDVARKTLAELNLRKPAANSAASNLTFEELQKKVIQRSQTKAKWALDQIKAIEIHSSLFYIKSSFAGAFGCPQFIPSSYQQYAVAAARNKKPNLFDMKDCIFSVANYLHKNGWNNDAPQSQSDALFEYNRIRDYGDVIQKLASAAAQ